MFTPKLRPCEKKQDCSSGDFWDITCHLLTELSTNNKLLLPPQISVPEMFNNADSDVLFLSITLSTYHKLHSFEHIIMVYIYTGKSTVAILSLSAVGLAL